MPELLGNVASWASRQKDKYFGQNEAISESELKKLDASEKQNILNTTEIHADPFNGKSLTVRELQTKGLAPSTTFDVDGVQFAISDPYEIHGRLAVVAYVKAGDGKFVARSYYRSNSQGLWRLLPAYLGDDEGDIVWFGKGAKETAITAPIAVQKQLAEISSHKPINVKDPEFIFAGLSRDLTTGHTGTVMLGVDKVGKNMGLDTNSLSKTSLLNQYKGIGKRPPESLEPPPQSKPDYSRVLKTWRQPTDLYGEITVEVFASKDQTLKYMINRDSNGRVWPGVIENDSKIDDKGIGLRQQWIDEPDLTTPAYEYEDQAGSYANFADKRDNYVDMSKNYLDKIPMIIEYKESLKNRKKSAEQVEPINSELTKRNQELSFKTNVVVELVQGMMAFVNVDANLNRTKYKKQIDMVHKAIGVVESGKISNVNAERAISSAQQILKQITDQLPVRFDPDGNTSNIIASLSFQGGGTMPLEINLTSVSVQRKLETMEASHPNLKEIVLEQLAALDIKEKKGSVRESFLNFAKGTFAKGKNILEEIYNKAKDKINNKKPEETRISVADLPVVETNDGESQTETAAENKLGSWKKLVEKVRSAVASGKNILDQKVQQHRENKEKNSLEYLVREAVAAAIEYPIEMVEMDSTFADLGLYLEASGPDTVKFKKVIEKLGMPKLDFTITETATVADILVAVKTQREAAKISTVSYGTDLYEPRNDRGMSEDELSKKPEKAKANPESLRSLAKRQKQLWEEFTKIQEKLEANDGLTPNEKTVLLARQAELEEQLRDNEAHLKQRSTGVPWQSLILTAGASALARKGLVVGGATLLGTPAALVAAPVAGLIAGTRDAIRARGEGGATKLYQAATQDTVSALTTGRGSERKGHESEAEFQKNRWQGWQRSPLWLLRKVGVVANAPRALLVQGAYGVSRDRSTLSRLADSNGWQDNTKLTQADVTKWISDTIQENPKLVMELGRRLNRLAALTEYGSLDVAGEKGSLFNRVSVSHDKAFLELLHQFIDLGVKQFVTDNSSDERQKFLTKWNEHAGYQSKDARMRAERSAKIKGVVASAVGTMMTAGIGSTLTYFVFGDGIEDIHHGAEQIKAAINEDLKDLRDSASFIDDHLLSPLIGDQQIDAPGEVAPPAIVNSHPGTWEQTWHDATNPVDSAPVGPQKEDVVDKLPQIFTHVKEPADFPPHEVDSLFPSVAKMQLVELKTGVPWNDIKEVVSDSGVTSDGQVATNTIVDGLKDFWKALQPKDFDFNNIDQHAKFLSLDGVKSISELPALSDGAAGYHLSDSQLTHLAEWWKEAAQVEHPTDLQQIARDLNGLETGQPMLFDELAKNPKAMQQLLDIANGVPPLAETVK